MCHYMDISKHLPIILVQLGLIYKYKVSISRGKRRRAQTHKSKSNNNKHTDNTRWTRTISSHANARSIAAVSCSCDNFVRLCVGFGTADNGYGRNFSRTRRYVAEKGAAFRWFASSWAVGPVSIVARHLEPLDSH